ncbi:hypothetical protein E2C01_095237 [Portunus trituberculatus]|uniref:Uncharacterized protein n=1 Tax=Portunus trituberculatus TaxID=210409 RepID=A0A5B7JY92_PORTR|nr:hypothetical protein [Portunus trituberculatus]
MVRLSEARTSASGAVLFSSPGCCGVSSYQEQIATPRAHLCFTGPIDLWR